MSSSPAVGVPEPDDVLSCCEVLSRYFEPKQLLESEKAELRHLKESLRPFNFQVDVNNLLTRFLPGSRVWIFEECKKWLELLPNDPNYRGMVLYGGPGLGKSTVAAALVANNALGGPASPVVGYYFCKHDDQNRSDPVLMIRTLAYQLAVAVPALRPHLLPPKLTPERLSELSKDVEDAFKCLLLEPLDEIKADLSSRQQPLVLVIDGLDEVAVAGSTRPGDNAVLRLIRDHFSHLPPAVRFIVTSRPEPHIENFLDAAMRPLKIKPNDPRHTEDLRALIQHELVGRLKGIGGGEPTADEVAKAVQMLLDKSEGVFVYLARLLDGLKNKSRWSLSDLDVFPKGLYATYTAFFKKHVERLESPKFADISRLLSVLLAAQEPLTVELLTEAWNATGKLPTVEGDGAGAGGVTVAERMRPKAAEAEVNKLLARLGSLYSVLGGRVSVFHKSFHDFLESPMLAGEPNDFWVDPFLGHTLLAETAAPLTVSVDAARAYSSQHQPSSMPSYGLHYGPHHLAELQLSGESAAGPLLEALVQNFAFLSAAFSSGCGHDLIRALLRLRQPTKKTTPAIVLDVLRWLLLRQADLSKAEGVTEDDVLASGMRCPVGTMVFKVTEDAYLKRMKSLGRPCWTTARVLGAGASWPACLMNLKGHSEAVFSVSWSPDGKQLASGSRDESIRVWDVGSGACVATLEGHSWAVTSVSWSPDGKQLASGSRDRSIRVWDAGSGACVATLEGHSGDVNSVSWSLDGKQLASGSRDRSIRVWDAGSGACVATLEGHSEAVTSVSWSPDGKQLASGSVDESIRVWDAGSGACVATLEGHSGDVNSVSWSPDGKQLASGSWDESIRVWDAGSGACVATLEGHSRAVSSVSWSPDGKKLASGSVDESIRVWDVGSGACVATLEGHSEAVFSVSWSPDGKQLASGSVDESIRVWDAGSGACVATLEGHSGDVTSVSWSPDGKQLASGSWDRSIRVWDAGSGACVATLEGHSGEVTSVSWSPDGKQLASGSVDESIRLFGAH